MKRIQLLFVLFALSGYVLAQNNVYPPGAGVINLTEAPYNADPTGMVDATSAIQQAMDDHPNGNYILYLPDGTYKISDRIDWPRVNGSDTNCGTEQSCRYTTLQGQSKTGTILQLIDNAPAYQDPDNRRAVLWSGLGAAQRFSNYLLDLTVHTGSGNPGAVGVQFRASNSGGIINVDIISGDGQGVYGIDFRYHDEIGPMIIRDVEVDGFDIGIYTFFTTASITFENITLRNQGSIGLFNAQQVLFIENLNSFNSVPAIRQSNQSGYITLIDSYLECTGCPPGNSIEAIRYGSQVFLRNITTDGYGRSIVFLLNGTTPVTQSTDPYIEEFTSSDPLQLCASPSRSLNLPITPTPSFARADTSDWAIITDFGAVKGDGMDDGPAIQAALNSGKSTIVIPHSHFEASVGSFELLSDVTIPSSVTHIFGTRGSVRGTGSFITSSGGPLLVMEHCEFTSIDHQGSRELLIQHGIVRAFTSMSGSGDLFLDNVQFEGTVFNNKKIWARQLNIEGQDNFITNQNSDLWVLGYKTEREGIKFITEQAGRTEILGAYIFSTGDPKVNPIFIVDNASLSLAAIKETNFNGNIYDVMVEETRAGETLELLSEDTPGGLNAGGFALFTAYQSSGNNTSPTVRIASVKSQLDPDNTFLLSAEVADDGLPGTVCNPVRQWRKISGPGDVMFSAADADITDATLTMPGIYEVALDVDDNALVGSDTITLYLYEQSITTEDDDQDGLPSGNGADSQVSQGGGAGERNYGGSEGLAVRNDVGPFDRKAYIRFDLNTINDNIDEAVLRLDIATSNSGVITGRTYNVFGLDNGGVGEDWVEGIQDNDTGNPEDITNNNAPGNISAGGGTYDAVNDVGGGVDPAVTTFLGTFNPTPRQRDIVEFRSQALTDFLNTQVSSVSGATDDRLYTFIITRVETGASLISFASKENTDRVAPTLYINSGALLPLDWLHINAQRFADNIYVTWETANEINVDRFIIEYSNDGQKFSIAREVKAENNVANNYQVYLSEGSIPIRYIRTKQLDLDGAFTYSRVVRLGDSFTEDKPLTLSPTQVSRLDELVLSGTEGHISGSADLYDMYGRHILHSAVHDGRLQSTGAITLSGWYVIRVHSLQGRSVARVYFNL